MPTIHLHNSTKVAQVDAADVPMLNMYVWRLVKKRDKEYAVGRDPATKRRMYMHRLIMGEPKGKLVDHKDRDGLNNTRGNLRICTRTENMGNTRPHCDRASQYKGVHRVGKRKPRWEAQICFKKKRMKLGRFDNEEDAARAYDVAALELFGKFAHTNFKYE